MDSFETRRENDIQALISLQKFGWLRAQELGWVLWPGTVGHGHTQACRAAKSWVERGLMLARKLPEQSGSAYVIAAKGVQLLAEEGISAASGKDIGEMRGATWIPPAAWRHDLLCAGVLVRLVARNSVSVVTDFEIRRRGEKLAKIPDAIVILPNKNVAWIEVEQAKKTGNRNLKPLGQALALAANGEIEAVCGHRANFAMVIFDKQSKVDHQSSVRKAIEREAKKDVTIHWVACDTVRGGVTRYEITEERLKKNDAAKILRTLEASSSTQIAQTWHANYGKHQVKILIEKSGRCLAHVNDEIPFACQNLAEGKRVASEAIELLLNQAK